MSRREQEITQAERSVFFALGMTGLAGITALQAAHNPELHTMAEVFVPAFLGLAAVNLHTAQLIVQREREAALPFPQQPLLNVVELEKVMGLAS